MAQSAPQSSEDGLRTPQIVQIGPLAQVQCSLSNDGQWMLRKYSNECGIERIKVERLHGAQHVVQGTKEHNGTSEMQVRNGVLVKPSRQPKQQVSDFDKNLNSPGKEGSVDSSSQQSKDSETFLGTTPRKVRLRDDSPTKYDPRAVAEEDDMNPEHIPIPQTSKVFKGTATSGYDRPCFKSKGEWYFQTAGGDDIHQSSETIAALEMGGQGLFEPDTNHPTAEEVHNYQKCHKRFGKGTMDRSQKIIVVWKPNSDKPAHEEPGPEAETLAAQNPPNASAKGAVPGPCPAKCDSKSDETPVSPRTNPGPSKATKSNDDEDPSKLMPPPVTPFDPTNNSARKPRTSNASASSRRSSGRDTKREDIPHLGSSGKRKSSEAGSASGSPPKALKLDSSLRSSSRTSWPDKNSLRSTLRTFDNSVKNLSIGKSGGDAQTKADPETVPEESEVETGTKEDNDEEKKKEQDRESGEEAGEDSEK